MTHILEDTKQAEAKNGLTFPCHHAIHVSSVMSCLFMSHHMPHHYGELCNYLFKMYCKVEAQRTHTKYEES